MGSYQYTILVISRSFLLRMRNVSDESYRENQKTHVVFSKDFFFRKLCRLWDNLEKYCRAGQVTMTIWRMPIAGYKSTNSGSVIVIVFPLQQWLHESASVLPFTYKVVQIWPGLFTLVYTQISPGHILTTLYVAYLVNLMVSFPKPIKEAVCPI